MRKQATPLREKFRSKPGETQRAFPRRHLVIACGLASVLTLLLMHDDSDVITIAEDNSIKTTVAKTDFTSFSTEQHATPSPTINSEQELAELLTAYQENASVTKLPESAPTKLYLEEVGAEEIDLKEIDTSDGSAAAWQSVVVNRGDNLTKLFQRAGLSINQLYQFLDADSERELAAIHPGDELSFQIENGELKGLVYQKSPLKQITYERADNGFVKKEIDRNPETIETYRQATIENSLFLSGINAGMDDALIMNLAKIFQWDIDFALDIREGDSFRILYEERYLDGKKLSNGPILAAEFINQGKIYKAVRYTSTDGNSDYFTPDGKSMKKEFLRTPVDFARISSHFNLRRRHPVLNTIRAHKGTDYAAPTGTPIRAAGDGKVIHAGTKGGYGRTVIIQHGDTYKTLYAHLHRYGKGMKSGKSVKQGDIIGYVGSSGLASGPHLHYEFYVNGQVKDPVKVKLPKAQSISKNEKNRFLEQSNNLIAQLDSRQTDAMYASNAEAESSTSKR